MINAHTGQISRYALDDVPTWVDRVYSQQMAMTIANWYGEYSQAGFQGIGSSNANRFQVSGDPVMVYTGGGHPVWRMLLTSHNNDNSVSKIIEMNAATGAMRIYTPQLPMGIEAPVSRRSTTPQASAPSLVKADHYQAVDLTLHVIYGHLTWMATYEPEGSNPSFVGHRLRRRVPGDGEQRSVRQQQVGRAAELPHPARQPGLRQRDGTGTRRPVPDGNRQDRRHRLGHHRRAEVLVRHPGRPAGHVYVGTVASVGPALVLAQPGDPVTITVLNVGVQESTQTMQSFTDARVPLNAPGS